MKLLAVVQLMCSLQDDICTLPKIVCLKENTNPQSQVDFIFAV